MKRNAHTSRGAKFGLVFAGLGAGLVVTELVLRMALPNQGFRFPVGRITDARFEGRAGRTLDGNGLRYTFDGDGFRLVEAPVGEGSATVLFIGDSFTEGMGGQAQECFPAVTCAELARRGRTARCLNAGVSGFGTAHELRLMRRLLERPELHIDAVVFQVLPNNDLRDNWEDGGFTIDGERLIARDPARVPVRVWLRDLFLNNDIARGSRIVTLAANASFNGLGMDPHYDDGSYALERRLLQDVVATTRARGVPLVVLVAATAWELDRQRAEAFDERDRLDFVTATVRELGVPWIDSRSVADGPEYYIRGDGHFSVAGNAAVGAALAARLVPLLEGDRK